MTAPVRPLPDRFETDRLLLRPIAAHDAPVIFASYTQDPDVVRFLTWKPHRSIADTEAYVASCMAAEPARTRTYAITGGADGVVLGAFDLRRPNNHSLGFGYVLARSAWGHGFMTEVLTCVTAWGLNQPEVWRVADVCDVENKASARVMEKAGLVREGILHRWIIHPNLCSAPRDCIMYAKVK